MENKDVALYRRLGAAIYFGGMSLKEKLSNTVSLHDGHGVNDLKAPACAQDKEVKMRRIVQEVTRRLRVVSKIGFEKRLGGGGERRKRRGRESWAAVWSAVERRREEGGGSAGRMRRGEGESGAREKKKGERGGTSLLEDRWI
ncbi:hypothetical protein Droror1_Dr00000612 [Drosera rotundifolia]